MLAAENPRRRDSVLTLDTGGKLVLAPVNQALVNRCANRESPELGCLLLGVRLGHRAVSRARCDPGASTVVAVYGPSGPGIIGSYVKMLFRHSLTMPLLSAGKGLIPLA